MTCYMEYKSFLKATADQHFFDGSNARWVGLLFASNAPLCGAEQGSNARRQHPLHNVYSLISLLSKGYIQLFQERLS